MNKPKKTILCICLGLFFFIGCASGQAAKIADENEVKAAFIFNFLKFIEWPAEAFSENDSTLKICLIEKTKLCDKVVLIDGKMANQRVIRVESADGNATCSDCHAVVVCEKDQTDINKHLLRFKNKHVLTISDCKNFAQNGGMIGLMTISGKVRFSINLREAEAAGLKISSQLLKLAVEVIR